MKVPDEIMGKYQEVLGYLNELIQFFEKYGVTGWVWRMKEARDEAMSQESTLEGILNGLRIIDWYYGRGMGSMSDLLLSRENGIPIPPDEDEDEVNRKLEEIAYGKVARSVHVLEEEIKSLLLERDREGAE